MNEEHTTSEPVKTVLVITTGFLVLYALTYWTWSIYVAIIVGLVGIISQTITRWIHIGWMQLARILGLVVPKLLLSLIFFIILTPLALLYRVFKKDNHLYLKNEQQTLFMQKATQFTKADFEKPW